MEIGDGVTERSVDHLFIACGTLTVSIAALLDPDSAFLELSPLAAHEVYPDELPGAGIVTGIGE